MTEEEIEAWFELGERGMAADRFPTHWEVTVFDRDGHLEGEGEGDTLNEALGVAIVRFQQIYCGAV